MPKIDINTQVPPLPEGWEGTPDDLFEYFTQNAIFNFDGDFPTGQIGGARPTEDIGVWFGDYGVEKFTGGKYRPISDVPIGALLPWASASLVTPDNYILCDGRSLTRTDYAELFTVVGITWGSESPTTFSLPDLRGRHPVGAGIGDYKPQGITGRMKELTAGAYVGFEWTTRAPLPPNAPTKSMKDQPLDPAKSRFLSVQAPALVVPWIIRSR